MVLVRSTYSVVNKLKSISLTQYCLIQFCIVNRRYSNDKDNKYKYNPCLDSTTVSTYIRTGEKFLGISDDLYKPVIDI